MESTRVFSYLGYNVIINWWAPFVDDVFFDGATCHLFLGEVTMIGGRSEIRGDIATYFTPSNKSDFPSVDDVYDSLGELVAK